MQIFLVLALIVAIVAVIFALQNPATVTVSLLFWQFDGSLALVLLVSLTAGVLISLLVSVPAVIRRSRGAPADRRTIETLRSQLAERDQQIKDLEARLSAPPPAPVEMPKPSPPEEVELPPFTPPDIPS